MPLQRLGRQLLRLPGRPSRFEKRSDLFNRVDANAVGLAQGPRCLALPAQTAIPGRRKKVRHEALLRVSASLRCVCHSLARLALTCPNSPPSMIPHRAGSSVIGQTISHYRIIEKLGGGGMGVVYNGTEASRSLLPTCLGPFDFLPGIHPEELKITEGMASLITMPAIVHVELRNLR